MLSLGFLLLACFTVTKQFPASLLEHDNDESRIYGGRLANQGEFPWMVNLEIEKPDRMIIISSDEFEIETSTCGGFLISRTHVLTAAHCLCENATTNPKLYVNVTNIIGRIGHVNKTDACEVMFDKMYVHQDYDKDENNDIAILKLQNPIQTFNRFRQTICIANNDKKYKNRQAVVQMGWGRFDNVSDDTPTMKTTSLGKILDNQTCKKEMRKTPGRGQLCVSNASGDKICEGDSGGPLVIINGKENLAVGIVSYDYYVWCVKGNDLPAMYTDIGYYARWIKKTISDEEICWKN